MKKFLLIQFFKFCSANQEKINQEVLFNDQMTIEEFKLKLDEYAKKSYPKY